MIILIPSKLREPGSEIVEYNSNSINSNNSAAVIKSSSVSTEQQLQQSSPALFGPGEFIIHTLKRSYVMKAETAEIARNWIRAIELWTLYRASCSTD